MALEDIANKAQELKDKAQKNVKEAVDETTQTIKDVTGVNMGSGELASKDIREQNLSSSQEAMVDGINNMVDYLKDNTSIETSEAWERTMDILLNGGSADDLTSAIAETGMPQGLISAGFIATWSKNFTKGILVGHKETGMLSGLNNSGILKGLWDGFRDVNKNKKEIFEHNAKLLKEAEKEAKHANDIIKLEREFNFKIAQLNNELARYTAKASDELKDVAKEAKAASQVAKEIKGVDSVADAAKMAKQVDTASDVAKDAKALKTAKDFLDVAELKKFSTGAHALKTGASIATAGAKTAAISGVKMFTKNPLLAAVSSGLVGFGAYSSYNTAMENKEAIINVQAQIEALQKEIASDPKFMDDIKAQLEKLGKDTSKMDEAEMASSFLYEFRVVVAKLDEAQKSGNEADIKKYKEIFDSSKEKYLVLSTLEAKHQELGDLMGKNSIIGSFSESSKESLDKVADSMFSAGGAIKPFCWIVGAGAKLVGYADELQTGFFGSIGKTMAKATNKDIITDRTNIDAMLDGYHPNAFAFLQQVKGGNFSGLENYAKNLNDAQLKAAREHMAQVLSNATGAKVEIRDGQTYYGFVNTLTKKGIDLAELEKSNGAIAKDNPQITATILDMLQKGNLDTPHPVDNALITSVANNDKKQQELSFAKVV